MNTSWTKDKNKLIRKKERPNEWSNSEQEEKKKNFGKKKERKKEKSLANDTDKSSKKLNDMDEKRKMRASKKIKPKKDDVPNIRTFLGIDGTKR